MIELEQAQMHLRECQDRLFEARQERRWSNEQKDWVKGPGGSWRNACERSVLAALSWVWDAQSRAGILQVRDDVGDLTVMPILSGTLRVGDIITWPNSRALRVVA